MDMSTGVAAYQTAVSDGGVAFYFVVFGTFECNSVEFSNLFSVLGGSKKKLENNLFSRKSQVIRFLYYRGLIKFYHI